MATPKTLIFSVALNGYDLAYRRALQSHADYAARVGAIQVTVTRPSVRDPALAAWLKIPLMRRSLESDWDWVAYVDADCEFKEGAPSFTQTLEGPEGGKGDIFMAEGRSGRINSGVMIARSSEGSRRFFNYVEESIDWSIPEQDRAGLKYENGNVIHVDRVIQPITRLDLRWNNTFDPELPDYVRHYAGPLRPSYDRSAFDTVRLKARRLLSKRPSPQPDRRSEEFATSLAALTDRVASTYAPFNI